MTNCASDNNASAHSEHIRRFLTEYGVTDARGLEIMRLVRRAAHAYDMSMSGLMRDRQLSAPRWRLLLRLYMEERCGTPAVSPTQLSKAQNVSKNTISAHLRALEEQGLIIRELDAADRRQFRIRLSDAGRTLVRASIPGHIEFMNDLLAGLDADEVAQLQGLLEKLIRSLTEHRRVGEI
jgi:DNA-binding MarR family transcriptional regulator